MTRIVIAPEPFSPEAELREFAAARGPYVGALASFVGYCRAGTSDVMVEQLELHHYAGFTEAEVERLALGVCDRRGLADLLVIHRVGAIPAGEPIVLVAALSAHRAAAFDAVSEMMDYLKTDAPFWKREVGQNGARWIEPTAADYVRSQERQR